MQPPAVSFWSFDGRAPIRCSASDTATSCGAGHGDSSPRAPVNLARHYNRTTLARKGNPMKGFYKYFMIPGITNLAGGLPYNGYFPFDTLESESAAASRLESLHNAPAPSPAASSSSGSFSLFSRSGGNHLTIPKSDADRPLDERIDIDTVLQYGRATGLGSLAEFIRDFTINHLHQGRIPYADPATLPTCGSTDGMNKVVSLIGSRGDNMLCEEFAYNPALSAARPHGIGVVVVDMDEQGLVVDGANGLREILDNWTPAMGRKPHFLYTVSIGHNPTGSTTELPRMREIYKVCQQHDVIIVEDNPYWYLQYTESSHQGDDFLAALTPSYLTIDVDGRVIRLDTFSKTIAPGCRLGWITAQSDVIQRLVAITEASTQCPSGFVQAHVAKLLVRHWGMDGWIQWLSNLRNAYEKRMRIMTDVLLANDTYIAATTHRSTVHVAKLRMFELQVPDGGMFVWARLRMRNHPAYKAWRKSGGSKAEMAQKLWMYVTMKKLSLVAPGELFRPDETVDTDEYLRFCFAAVKEDELRDATVRFCDGVKEFWELDVGEIGDIGEEDVDALVTGEDAGKGWDLGVYGC